MAYLRAIVIRLLLGVKATFWFGVFLISCVLVIEQCLGAIGIELAMWASVISGFDKDWILLLVIVPSLIFGLQQAAQMLRKSRNNWHRMKDCRARRLNKR